MNASMSIHKNQWPKYRNNQINFPKCIHEKESGNVT